MAGTIVAYGRTALVDPVPEGATRRGYYLSGVCVCPASRRTGIGRAVTEARLDWISKRAQDAWFFTSAHNTASIGLHRKFGFEEVSRCFSFPGVTFTGGEGILFRCDLRERGDRVRSGGR